jgi:SAM-dependent methyltransferase
VHPQAIRGFGTAASAYERGRHGYPAEAVDHLVSKLRLAPRALVVDVAAGTGKLTRALLPAGARVVAVEPVEGMRRKLVHELRVETVAATAEELPFRPAGIDAVTAGQAWHWFDGGRALEQVHRILRPNGGFGLIWNVRDESEDWVAKLTTIMEGHRAGTPTHRGDGWKRDFEDSDRFEPLQLKEFESVHVHTSHTLVDRVVSVSFIASLPENRRAQVRDDVLELCRSHPALAGRREFELPYRTRVFTTRKS